MAYLAWFGLSSLVLGAVLFFPMRKLLLAMAINRHQRKVQRAINAEEIEILNRKMTVTAAAIAVTFAFVYTRYLMARFFG